MATLPISTPKIAKPTDTLHFRILRERYVGTSHHSHARTHARTHTVKNGAADFLFNRK